MSEILLHKQEPCIGKKKADSAEIAPPSPQVILLITKSHLAPNNTARDLPADLRSQIKPFRP
jgi:hypothetical protein